MRRSRAPSRRASTPVLVRPRPGHPTQAIASRNGRVLRLAIGRSGIKTLKREGDGASPRARIRSVAMFCRTAPAMALPWRPVRAGDGWCDAPESPLYNGWVPRGTRLSHEVLQRPDGLYDWVVMTDHNQLPRRLGAGSAIFVHVARAAMTPTEGCLAFARDAWRRGVVPAGPFLVGCDPRPVR